MKSAENYQIERVQRNATEHRFANLNLARCAQDSAEQSSCINEQQRPFQQTGELLRGFAVGTINTAEGFIEFLAAPDAVNCSLVGIGPLLDNAVNYYGSHAVNGTLGQIQNDAMHSAHCAEKWLASYSHRAPEKRGEVVAGLAINLLTGELIAETANTRFALNAAEQFESKIATVERFESGVGGEWNVLNERPARDVVKQAEWDSCAAACAEMLSDGKVTQSAAFAHLKVEGLDQPGVNAQRLPEVLGPEWASGRLTNDSIKGLLRRGKFAAELKDWTLPGRTRSSLGHIVVVDGLDEEGLFRIRDPQDGTRYEMMPDEFLRVWTGLAVYRA